MEATVRDDKRPKKYVITPIGKKIIDNSKKPVEKNPIVDKVGAVLTGEPPSDNPNDFFNKQKPKNYGFESQPSDVTSSDTTTPISEDQNDKNMNPAVNGQPYVNDKRTVVENGQMKDVNVYTSTPEVNPQMPQPEWDANGNLTIPGKTANIQEQTHAIISNGLNSIGLDPTSDMGIAIGSALNPIVEGFQQIKRGENEKSANMGLLDGVLGLAKLGIGMMPQMAGVNLISPMITDVAGNVAETLGLNRQQGEKVGQMISFAPFGKAVMLAGLVSNSAGEFVSSLIKDKDLSDVDKERAVELASQVGFFTGLGLQGMSGKVYRNIMNRVDLQSDITKLNPQQLDNAMVNEIQKERTNSIIQTLEKDKAEVQKQFEEAQTPEERLQAVNTLDKIEKKQAEYKEKNLPKKEKVTGNQPTRRATQEVPEQRSYEEVVDEFFQAKDNNEPYPLPKQSDLMDVQDKGKFNNLSYQISQHNLNLAKSTGDVSLINPEYVNTEFKNIKGQVKKFGVEPPKPKETSLKSESVEIPVPEQVKTVEPVTEIKKTEKVPEPKQVKDSFTTNEVEDMVGKDNLQVVRNPTNVNQNFLVDLKTKEIWSANDNWGSEWTKLNNPPKEITEGIDWKQAQEFKDNAIKQRSSPKSLPKPEPVKPVETKEVPVAVEKKPYEMTDAELIKYTEDRYVSDFKKYPFDDPQDLANQRKVNTYDDLLQYYADAEKKRGRNTPKELIDSVGRDAKGIRQMRIESIKDTFAGKTIPEEILKDYPELPKPTQPKPKRTPKSVEQPKGRTDLKTIKANALKQIDEINNSIKDYYIKQGWEADTKVTLSIKNEVAQFLKDKGYKISKTERGDYQVQFDLGNGVHKFPLDMIDEFRKKVEKNLNDRPVKQSNASEIKKDNEKYKKELFSSYEDSLKIYDSKKTPGEKKRYETVLKKDREDLAKFIPEPIIKKFEEYVKAKNDLGKLPDKMSAFPVDYYAKQIKNLATIGKYHIENGAKAFTKWAKEMVKDVGEWIRPKLRTLWNELTKDRTGLPNMVKQGADFDYSSFKRGGKRDVKAERKMIEDNLKGDNEPKTVHSINLNYKTRQIILASDIFTKGDNKAGKDVFNYDNFSTKEQLNDLVEQSAKENKPEIDAQKRDIRTWAKTSEGANVLKAMGWDENSLMRAVKGDSFLAERILASKDFINTAGHELLKAMQELPKTADAKVELADKFMKYNVMVKNTKGLISEAGRALNIVKRKSAEDVKMKIDLADELVRLGLEGDDIAGLDKALKIIDATAKDKIYYWWYNSMLSNPLTDVANIGGNVTHFSWELMQTALTENPRTTLKILQDIKDAHGTGIDEVKRIFRGQENTESKFDYKDRIYAEAFIPKSKFGKAVKSVLPTTRLAMEDAYFRNLAGGLRKYKTLREISKETGDSMAQVQSLLDAVYKNPELALLDKKFEVYEKHLKALERYIDFLVFQTPLGEGGKYIQHGINKIPVLKTVMPFMKIAVNLTKTGLRQTPYGLKDLVFKKDLTPLEKKDVIRRAVLGSVFFAGIGKLMADDIIEITGHGVDDRDKRELWYKQGYRENHFYIKVNGEKYGFSYTNINPANTLLSIIGSYSDDQKYNQTKKDAELNIVEKGTKALLGAVEVLTTQSFMQGMANTIDMIKNNDPEMIKKSLQNMFMPSILSFPRDVSNYIKGDKKQYETKTALDRLKDKTGMTESLKPKLNQFGEEKTSSLQRFPYPVTKLKSDEPLTDFLVKNEIEIAYPNKNTKLGNDVMTEDQYYEYVKLSGPAIKKALSEKLTVLNSFATAEERDKATHLIVDSVREQVRENMKALTKDEIEAKKKEDKEKREDNKDMKEKLGLKTEKKSTKSGKYKPLIIK